MRKSCLASSTWRRRTVCRLAASVPLTARSPAIPLIIVLAYYVVQWDTGVLLKLLVVVLGSLLVSLGLVELIVRRVRPLRRVFGIKARRQETPSAAGG